jgi:hypothetical protein
LLRKIFRQNIERIPMNKIFKVVLVIVSMLVLVSCGVVAQTPLPTYTPYPTYTPLPSATDTSTPVPTPTQKPVPSVSIDNAGGYVEMTCPSTVNPPAGYKAKCYVISRSPIAIGMTFSRSGNVSIIGLMFEDGLPSNIMNETADFFVEQAQMAGWNINDVLILSNKIENTPQNVVATYGDYAVQWADDGQYTMVIYGKR